MMGWNNNIDKVLADLVIFATLVLVVLAFFRIRQVEKNKEKDYLIQMQKDIKNQADQKTKEYKGEIKKLVEEIEDTVLCGKDLSICKDALDEISTNFKTGITELDVLLGHKSMICKSYGIDFKARVIDSDKSGLSREEIISLIGNLLDNGIEAAKGLNEPFVSISSKSIKGVWLLSVSNKKDIDHSPIINNMKTTKVEKTKHGMGIKIVKRIAREHKGEVRLIDKGDEFEVLVNI
ncbi:MAG: GHKL domain-containing protein [Anaerovoracaceae bacterium]